jgi:hypothetical protein
MSSASITEYITTTFPDIQIATSDDNSFYYYGPDGEIPERIFPFATLVTNDRYDQVSNLSRPDVFRLNISVSKPTFLSLFDSQPAAPGESGIIDTGHDFTVLDELLPHPVYGHLLWVCVLNPGSATFPTVRTLLAEAYDTAVRKQSNRDTKE